MQKRIKISSRKRKRNKTIILECLLTSKKKKFDKAKTAQLLAKLKLTDINSLPASYLSRTACTLLKQGYTEEEIRKQYNCTLISSISFDLIKKYIPSFTYKEKLIKKRKKRLVKQLILDNQKPENRRNIAPYTPVQYDLTNPEQVKVLTENTCLRPDIYLNGDRYCNDCYLFQLCACSLKRWNKKVQQKNIKTNATRIKKFKKI